MDACQGAALLASTANGAHTHQPGEPVWTVHLGPDGAVEQAAEDHSIPRARERLRVVVFCACVLAWCPSVHLGA